MKPNIRPDNVIIDLGNARRLLSASTAEISKLMTSLGSELKEVSVADDPLFAVQEEWGRIDLDFAGVFFVLLFTPSRSGGARVQLFNEQIDRLRTDQPSVFAVLKAWEVRNEDIVGSSVDDPKLSLQILIAIRDWVNRPKD